MYTHPNTPGSTCYNTLTRICCARLLLRRQLHLAGGGGGSHTNCARVAGIGEHRDQDGINDPACVSFLLYTKQTFFISSTGIILLSIVEYYVYHNTMQIQKSPSAILTGGRVTPSPEREKTKGIVSRLCSIPGIIDRTIVGGSILNAKKCH